MPVCSVLESEPNAPKRVLVVPLTCSAREGIDQSDRQGLRFARSAVSQRKTSSDDVGDAAFARR